MKLSLIPLLPFTVAFIGGILLQGCGMSGFFILLPLGAAIAAVLLRRHYAAILFAALVVGATVADLHTPHPLPAGLSEHNSDFSGVATEVRRYEPTQVVIVEVDSCDGKSVRPFRIKISVPSSIHTVDERQRMAFAASSARSTSILIFPTRLTITPLCGSTALSDRPSCHPTAFQYSVPNRDCSTPSAASVRRSHF